MDWFRSYHGAPTDPKWLVIGRSAGVEPGVVAAVWWALMDHASQAHPRGSVASFDEEAVATFFGWPEEKVDAVVEALKKRRMIEDGMLSRWLDRNPADYSTERVRAHRQRKTPTAATSETPGNAGNACNAMEHRGEEKRGDKRNRSGRLNVENSEHTIGTLALEADRVLGMGTWGGELDRKFSDTKRTILTQWVAGGVPLESIHRAIHGLRIMVDNEEVEWLKDRKQKPLDGIHVLTSEAVVMGPDGTRLGKLFQLAQEAYARDRPPSRTANTGPERVQIAIGQDHQTKPGDSRT